MYKLIFLYVFFIMIALNACNNQTNQRSGFFENSRLKDIMVIDRSKENYIYSETVHYTNGDTLVSYYKDDKKQLRLRNHANNTEDTLFLDSIFNSYNINSLLDYHFVSEDTVFVLMVYPAESGKRLGYGIFHFDMEGELYNHWDVNRMMNMEDPYFTVNSNYINYIRGMRYRNGILYCATNIIKKPLKAYDASEIPVVFVLDVVNDTGSFVYGKPEIYGQGNYFGNHAERQSLNVITDSTFVLSFPIDHHLFLYNMNGKLLKKKKCKSQYIDHIQHLPKKEKYTQYTPRERLNAKECNAYYYSLLYDRENELFYRFVFHKQPKINDKGKRNHPYDRSVSIMVIDKELNIIEEYYIPPYHVIPYPPKVDKMENLVLSLRGDQQHRYRASYSLDIYNKKN